jgi:hypothetical protein
MIKGPINYTLDLDQGLVAGTLSRKRSVKAKPQPTLANQRVFDSQSETRRR